MLSIPGRILFFPETETTDQTYRVDLKHLVTPRAPYHFDNLWYYGDRVPRPDYGSMLGQQLRRIDGIASVTITHYGCKVTAGALYEPRKVKQDVRRAVEFTLTSQIPWTVRRPDTLNWSFCFSERLIHPNRTRVDIRRGQDQDERRGLTGFGHMIASQFHTDLGGPYTLQEYNLFMKIDDDERDEQAWPGQAAVFEPLLIKLIGKRRVTIDWE